MNIYYDLIHAGRKRLRRRGVFFEIISHCTSFSLWTRKFATIISFDFFTFGIDRIFPFQKEEYRITSFEKEGFVIILQLTYYHTNNRCAHQRGQSAGN